MNEAMREKMVKRLALQKARWVVGGYENEIADGERTGMPTQAEMAEEVYREMVKDPTLEGPTGSILLKKDIRFMGAPALREIATQAVEKVSKE